MSARLPPPAPALKPDSATRTSHLDLTVVIPALDEGGSIGPLLRGIGGELDRLGVVSELILVDGGSSDATRELASDAGAKVYRQTGPGYGQALRDGFAQSRGDFVMTLDADGSHSPDFLARMWQARERADVVIASRYAAGGAAEMTPVRLLLSRILNLVFRRGLSMPFADLSSGYRLYRRSILAELPLAATGFDLLPEILIRANSAGFRIVEVPFRYRPRQAGRSHVRLVAFGFAYATTFLRMWRLRNSIASGDYDSRAYDSVIPLQRYWQRHRYRIVVGRAGSTSSVLDVGCGSSRILSANPRWVGLDVLIGKLRHASQAGNRVVQGSVLALPFSSGSFECVICSEVIEHIAADERVFDELGRVLRHGGRLILGTPDYDRWSWRALEAIYRRVTGSRGYAHEHITRFGRDHLVAYLESRGYSVEATDYVGRSELILTLRKGDVKGEPLPVGTALRSGRISHS
jgi:glycosyltransferase involved in cell wall biosynthesis/predicted SAM-dependent methyltransferase